MKPLCSVVLCSLASLILAVSASQRPNIIFIFGDDYGYNDIGYHGSPIQTPVLDQMAADGVKLENYYVQPSCTPSRSQLMTGRYQIHTGLQHGVITPMQPNSIPLDQPTIAEKIREAGYSTHMLGKWHLGYYTESRLPINRGFDSFFGFYQGMSDYYSHKFSFPYGIISGDDLHNGSTRVQGMDGIHSTFMYVDEATRIIEASKNSDKPMFMYLAFPNPHSPMEVPDHYMEPYANLPGVNRPSYAGLVAQLDEAVGNVTRALKDNGMLDNTLIVFSADNGGWPGNGGSNWPLRGQKMSLWEGGIRAIGFATGGPLKRKGIVSKELMHVSDWYPTLITLAGGSLANTAYDGVDQWPSLNEGNPSPRTEILHNIDPMTGLCGGNLSSDTFPTAMRSALRVGDMKLITGDPGPGPWTLPNATNVPGMMDKSCDPNHNVHLFNITDDPLEKNDLADSQPDLVRTMLDKLQKYQAGAVPVSFPSSDLKALPKFHKGSWEPWM